MKTTLTIILLLMSLSALPQRNSYYVSFQPGDIGIGVRYDHNHFYGSGSWGNYRFPNSGSYIKNHVRLAVGYKLDMPKEIGRNVFTSFTGGIVGHYYGEKAVYDFEFNQQEGLFPISVELGTIVRMGRVVTGFRFDVLKWEGVIDIGITFR